MHIGTARHSALSLSDQTRCMALGVYLNLMYLKGFCDLLVF